jgi:hypothetical protein
MRNRGRRSAGHLIGTALLEDLVQTVAVSHLITGHDRIGLLLLAAPESGKTTIATAAESPHVKRIVAITARSIMQLCEEKETEFLLFNDLAVVRALGKSTVALLINTLNQITQGESGEARFAGQHVYKLERQIGMIGCMPFAVFRDRRAHWRDMGFVSRMLPFSYSYDTELIVRIKDGVDAGTKFQPKRMPPKLPTPRTVRMSPAAIRTVRALADAKATVLDQIGIRLLKHYHALVRAHAIRHGRSSVTATDLDFLRAVDRYISITECRPL